MKPLTSRRTGQFTLHHQFISRHPDLTKEIMGKCIIYRAEWRYCSDSITYQATSDGFQRVPDGEQIPEYIWMLGKTGMEPKLKEDY